MDAVEIAVGRRVGRASPSGVPVAASHRLAGTGRTIVVTGARGGQGATTVAATLALFAAEVEPTTLVATETEAASAVLGVARRGDEPWLVSAGLRLTATIADSAAAMVVIDRGRVAGKGVGIADADGLSTEPVGSDGAVDYVVLRGPCYLALSELVAQPGRPDGIILVAEAGRSLTERDVTELTGIPVVAIVESSPTVARTIDAGLLVSRYSRLRELASLRALVSQPPATIAPMSPARPIPVKR